MKVNNISTLSAGSINFEGKRVSRNVTAQLSRNNAYSLSEPNQRYITNSIKELAKVPGEKNVNFLINTASRLKYATNIHLRDLPKNNWKGMLLAAAAAAATITPLIDKNKIVEKINKVNSDSKLNKTEQEILNLRENLLKSVDIKQIENETVGSVKDFEHNLDYFIISSETTTEQKKYVLKRLNYFMSDKYEINPQLKDKKSIAAAEMINDMAIHTPGHKIPNIKAINQKQHGICAAISIVRKKLAYEDKPNYIDSIISELDATDSISVYDRGKLGQGIRTRVQKVPVDFKTALANGYRIIDAASMQWMQVAQMSGASSIAFDEYKPFDKENFDVNADTLFNVKFDDPALERTQKYYQALIKAKNVLKNYKANLIKKSEIKAGSYQNFDKNISSMAKISETLKNKMQELDPDITGQDSRNLVSGILKLEHNYSDKINPDEKYAYIPNEENLVKKEKIKNFVFENSNIKNIDDKKLSEILDLADFYHKLSNENSPKKNSESSRAKSLYNAAAAFRYQMVKGLEEDITLENFMLSEGIKDRESLILDTISEVEEKLQNNSEDSIYIIEKLAPVFQCSKNRDEILMNLYGMEEYIKDILTGELDEIYESLAVKGGRKNALINYLEGIKSEIYAGNKELCKDFAGTLNIKPTPANVINAIEKFKTRLEDEDDGAYPEILSKLGNTSQVKYLADLYNNFINMFAQQGNDDFILKFMEIHNLSVVDDENAVVEKLTSIGNRINTISEFLYNMARVLTITDKDNDVIISPLPKEVILKKWENEGIIIPPKKLRELQTHFTNITKDRSKNESTSRQGKLNDKTLYKFTDSEKATLKEIKQNIIPMYSYIKKQLPKVERDLKDYLAELKRIIGVNNGSYWVHAEGESGLYKTQDARILEYMTGRPHYVTQDIKSAIEKIKTEPYSGISSSSVYHNEAAYHAQYIADIEPVKIKSLDGKETVKDILFHDNTWGAAEMENTWQDSQGLTRTDYSDYRGGRLGYITNEKFQNGNFVDRILDDMVVETEPDSTQNRVYKRLKHPDKSTYKVPQLDSVVLSGYSPEAKNTAAEIHDAIFIPSISFINKLEKFASEYTTNEIKELLKTADTAGPGWRRTYNELLKRIFSPFEEKINTLEDYNKLSDNDYLKVVLEKVALKWNYPLKALEPEIASAKNVKDLSKFKAAQKNRALNEFKYAFSKNLNIVPYVADSFREKENAELDKLLDDLKLDLTEEQKNLIGSNFAIDVDLNNGSAKNTIRLLLDTIKEDVDKITDDKQAKDEIVKFFKKYFSDKIYFNKSDLSNKKISHIINFIDREFDPENDNEFVKIYRKIQDMTTEEFRKEIVPRIKPEDLGIKNYTGFDVLKKLRHYDENAETSFINTVYYDNFSPDFGQENYKVAYTYNKLSRDSKIHVNYNLSSIYRDMASDLSYLTLPKLFNKYKASNMVKYGAYPAYPKVEYLEEDVIGYEFKSFMDKLTNTQNIIRGMGEQLKNYGISHKLNNYLSRIPDDKIITGIQFNNINRLLGEFITINYNDPSVTNAFEAAENAMEIPEGSAFKVYRKYLEIIVKVLQNLENTTSGNLIIQALDEHKKQLPQMITEFSKIFIQERYQNHLNALCHKYVQLLVKNNIAKAEDLRLQIYNEFIEHHILQNPKELLKSYILSVAKDSDNKNFSGAYKAVLSRALQYAQLANVQSILMDAASDGVEMTAKTMFGNYSLNIYGVDIPMSSGMVISQMVHRLLLNNQQETALMFIERLGLGEKYIEYMSENMDFESLKSIIKDTYKIINNFKKFSNEADEILGKTRESLPGSDIIKVIDKVKKELYLTGKKHNIAKKDIAPLLNNLDIIKDESLKNINTDRTILFDSFIGNAKAEIAGEIRNNVESAEKLLVTNTTIVDLINHILLPDESQANKLREEMSRKIKEILEYKNSVSNLQQEE